MGDDEQQKRPAVVPPGAYLQTVLPMALGIVAGRLAGDAVRDAVGWWGSLGVGMLAAIVVALATFVIVQAARRRG